MDVRRNPRKVLHDFTEVGAQLGIVLEKNAEGTRARDKPCPGDAMAQRTAFVAHTERTEWPPRFEVLLQQFLGDVHRVDRLNALERKTEAGKAPCDTSQSIRSTSQIDDEYFR